MTISEIYEISKKTLEKLNYSTDNISGANKPYWLGGVDEIKATFESKEIRYVSFLLGKDNKLQYLI